jgi:hypothetical protein
VKQGLATNGKIALKQSGAYAKSISIDPELVRSHRLTMQAFVNALCLRPEDFIKPRIEDESVVLEVYDIVSNHVDLRIRR